MSVDCFVVVVLADELQQKDYSTLLALGVMYRVVSGDWWPKGYGYLLLVGAALAEFGSL